MRNLLASLLLFFAGSAVQGQPEIALSQALDIAQKNHPDIASMRAEVDAALARSSLMLAQFRPQVSLNGTLAAGDGSMIFPGTVMPTNYALVPDGPTGILNGTLMWPIYRGGRERTTGRLVVSEVQMARLALAGTVLEVNLNLRLAFAEALMQDHHAGAMKAALVSSQEIERITKEKLDAGKVPEAFYLRAKAESASMQKELAMAEAGAKAAFASLREAMGLGQEGDDQMPGKWDDPEVLPSTLTEALAEARLRRPEILALNLSADVARMKGRLADQSLMPEVSLMAMSDWMTRRRMPGDSATKIGLVVNFPLGDGGERKSAAAEQRALAQKAVSESRKVQQKIEAEVATAWANYAVLPAVRESAELELAASTSAYEVAMLRYTEGKTILAELIEARAQLAKARIGIAEAEAYDQRARARLLYALGR
jgi:outer membrane protein TolC